METYPHKGQVLYTQYEESSEVQDYSSYVIRAEFIVLLGAGKHVYICVYGR